MGGRPGVPSTRRLTDEVAARADLTLHPELVAAAPFTAPASRPCPSTSMSMKPSARNAATPARVPV